MKILRHTLINHDNESMTIEIWQNNSANYEVTLYNWLLDIVDNHVLNDIAAAIYTYGQLIKKYSK